MTSNISIWKEWFEKNRQTTLQDYFHFLEFKSVGTDPQFDQETKACAQWLVEYLQAIGLTVELWKTSKQPVVFAHHCQAGKERPTLLIYHHYDVQPVDPLDLWESDPFQPVVRDGKVYARGAQDNKGQCFYSITALKAFFSFAEKLNFNLKVFIEGEEESGSEGTREVFKTKKEELKSDYLLVVDSGIPGPNIPAITLSLRGILPMDIEVRTADGDMHSGAMGGVAYNPIRALAKALSSFWDSTGRVTIPNFYDEVKTFSEEEKKSFYLEMDEEETRKTFGLRVLSPDPGFTIGESVGMRPTVEINGFSGGYTGEGFKTVLPAVAKAKVSCRLVPYQNPDTIFPQIKKQLEKELAEGVELHIEPHGGSAAFLSDPKANIAKVAAKAYEEVMGKPCQNILGSGSIPVVADLVEVTGAEAVIMGYALDTDQIHAPNEHFGLDRFEKGFLTMGMILSQLNEKN